MFIRAVVAIATAALTAPLAAKPVISLPVADKEATIPPGGVAQYH
jgi:hypothetical protein